MARLLDKHAAATGGRLVARRTPGAQSTVVLKAGLLKLSSHLVYCNEFDFRWNTRQSQGFNDSDRALAALKGIAGKRLTYRRICGESTQAQL